MQPEKQVQKTVRPSGREARAFPRVALPMSVRIGEAKFAASDWSVNGFALGEPAPNLGRGDVSRATLELCGAGVDVHIPLACEVVRATDAGAVGFRIVGLAPRQAEVLHRVVDDYLAGQTPALEQLLFRDEASAAADRSRHRWFGFGRVLAQGLVLVGLLTAAALGVAAKMLTFDAYYGAVTAPSVELASPAAGFVVAPERAVGAAVVKGELLFQVRAPEAEQRAAELQARRDQLEALKSQQMDRLLEIQSVSDELRASLERQMTALTERIAALDRRVALDTEDLSRARALTGRGFATRAELDRRSATLAARQQERAALEQERAALLADLKLAQGGVYRSDLRDNVPTIQVMLRRIDETEAQIAGIAEELLRLAEAANVHSPCDCEVHAARVRPGEVVKQGTPVLVLRERDGIAVDALILGEDARKLEIGNRGSVTLADGGERDGRVVEIAYDGGDPLRVGLPDRLYAAERYARVRLAVDDVAPDRVGMTAAVSFRRGWFDRMLATIGL